MYFECMFRTYHVLSQELALVVADVPLRYEGLDPGRAAPPGPSPFRLAQDARHSEAAHELLGEERLL